MTFSGDPPKWMPEHSPAAEPRPSRLAVPAKKVAARAQASWLYPLIAWGSQLVLVPALSGVRGGAMIALVWLLAAALQLILFIIAIASGVRVVAMGRAAAGSSNWSAACVGLCLSLGTVVLIIGLIIKSAM